MYSLIVCAYFMNRGVGIIMRPTTVGGSGPPVTLNFITTLNGVNITTLNGIPLKTDSP